MVCASLTKSGKTKSRFKHYRDKYKPAAGIKVGAADVVVMSGPRLVAVGPALTLVGREAVVFPLDGSVELLRVVTSKVKLVSES